MPIYRFAVNAIDDVLHALMTVFVAGFLIYCVIYAITHGE